MKENNMSDYFNMALEMAKDLQVPIIFGRIKEPFFTESCGLYLNETRTIWISTDVYNIARPTECLIHTIVHELVHAVQHILGAYESMNLPDDLPRIKANDIWKHTLMEEAPIFEVEADRISTQICESWGMQSMYRYEGYGRKSRRMKDHEFKNYMWNEVYQLEVEPLKEPVPIEEIKEAA
jgi:hypothetical protein